MLKKDFVLLPLLCGLILSVMIVGCGGDEEKMEPKPAEPAPNPEDLIASWTVISFNGEALEDIFSTPDLENEEEVEILKNDFVFTADNLWTWDLQVKFPFETIDGMIEELTETWMVKGTYTVSDSTLETQTTSFEITHEPESLLEPFKTGEEEEEEATLVLPENLTWDINEDTLTLTSPLEEMILKKQ